MTDAPADDVAAVLAEPLERFTEARNQRVKALKAAGRKDEAAALAKVRKPTRIVWLAGEVARRRPDEARQAAEVAERLEAGDGGDVRSLLGELRTSADRLAGAARGLDRAADPAAVALAVRSILGDADAREAWLAGRLLTLPGADELGGLAAAGSAGGGSRPASDAEVRRQAEKALREAERDLAAAERSRNRAADRVEQLDRRLAELRADRDEAQTAVDDAEQAVERARTAVEEARQGLG